MLGRHLHRRPQVGSIHTEFRTFDMEVLAGDEDFEVQLCEDGAKFQFNFKEVRAGAPVPRSSVACRAWRLRGGCCCTRMC